MLIPTKTNLVISPLSAQEQAGRIDILGEQDKVSQRILSEVLINLTEFIVTTILTAGLEV